MIEGIIRNIGMTVDLGLSEFHKILYDDSSSLGETESRQTRLFPIPACDPK